MPIPLLALAQGGAGAIQGIAGLFQGMKARKLAKQNIRPVATVSSDLESNVRLAKVRANQGLDLETYGRAVNDIWRNKNASLSSLRDRRSAMAGIGTTNAIANDSALKLNTLNAAKKEENEKTLMRAKEVLANDKLRVWDYNQRQKFDEDADAIRALRGAGQRNVMGALNNIGGAALQAYDQGMFNGSGKVRGNEWNSFRTKKRTVQNWDDYPED